MQPGVTYLVKSREVWPFAADVHEEARGGVWVRFKRGTANIFRPGDRFAMCGTPVSTIGLTKREARAAYENAAMDGIARLQQVGAL